jgi:hypothetical protein
VVQDFVGVGINLVDRVAPTDIGNPGQRLRRRFLLGFDIGQKPRLHGILQRP